LSTDRGRLGIVLEHLFFWLVVRPVVMVVLGLNVRHRERLPRRGPAILAANHNSHLDTAVLMTLVPARLLPRVRPVAAADYFLANRALAWFSLQVLGILPVERGGGSRQAPRPDPLAAARTALDRGEVVLLFPEGSRGDPERLAAFKSGVARLALAGPGVPVVPVFLHGLGKAMPKGAFLPGPFFCDVFVGEPLDGGDGRWQGDSRRLLAGLAETMQGLAAEGRFAAWE
jgi:1-acyl-sn-glycerol-3-phosphate acyltransferase